MICKTARATAIADAVMRKTPALSGWIKSYRKEEGWEERMRERNVHDVMNTIQEWGQQRGWNEDWGRGRGGGRGRGREVNVAWWEETSKKRVWNCVCVCVCVWYWCLYVGQLGGEQGGRSMNGNAERYCNSFWCAWSGFLLHPHL